MQTYDASEINNWGDVQTIKEGWARCSMMESRGCPTRYTFLVGFGGTRRYPKAIKDAVVPADWLFAKRAHLAATAEKRATSNARAAERRAAAKRELEQLAYSMGLLPDSRTFAAYLRGEIEEDEARSIGRYTSYRHEQTNYDDLLARGYSKDDARALMEHTNG